MRKITYLITAIMLSSGMTIAQGVGIKSDASATDTSAMLEIKSNSKGILIPRMTATQRNAINSPANGVMVYQTDTPAGYYYFDGTSWKSVGRSGQHYTGEAYGGGVVCWVDNTGQHGLIVSMTEVSTEVKKWSNITSTLVGQTARSDWDGLNNSNAIVGQSGHITSAAKLCLDYTNNDYGTGTFSDWYLPSRGEFSDLWNNMKAVQKTLDTDGNPATTTLFSNVAATWMYWTSNEVDASNAWTFAWFRGVWISDSKSTPRSVRCVRSF